MSAIGDVIDSRVDVVTRIGPDFPQLHNEVFRERGIDLAQWTCESPTTRFILDYTVKPRGLAVRVVCDEIEVPDIPESGCVIISPIVGEINESFLGSVEPDYLALDPQGLVRKIHDDGSITLEPWRSANFDRVDLLKTSIREHFYITGEPDPLRSLGKIMENRIDVAVITLGDEGSLVQSADTRLKVPVYPTESIDSTGVGAASSPRYRIPCTEESPFPGPARSRQRLRHQWWRPGAPSSNYQDHQSRREPRNYTKRYS